MRVTIADVARTAAVSKTTVSRVLNGKGEVDSTTAERVRGVIAELGYVPSSRAVSLARGNSRTLIAPAHGLKFETRPKLKYTCVSLCHEGDSTCERSCWLCLELHCVDQIQLPGRCQGLNIIVY